MAVQRWGEPRFTADCDLTLITEYRNEEDYIRLLLDRFPARRKDAADFALEYRVLLLRHENGAGLDISLGGLPFEIRSVSRATPFEFAKDIVLTTCSADDLIVHKAFANRDRDWGDIDSILLRQRSALNFDAIFSELEPLVRLKEEPEILKKLKKKLGKGR